MCRLPRLVVPLVALAVVLAACGSGSTLEVRADGGSLPAGEVTAASLSNAAAGAREAETGRFELELSIEASDGALPFEVVMIATGAYDQAVPASSMVLEVDLSELGAMGLDELGDLGVSVVGEDGRLRVETRQIGDVLYQQMPTPGLFGDHEWTSLEVPGSSAAWSDTPGMDPQFALDLLEQADGAVTELGPTEVRGVPTQAFALELSVAELVALEEGDQAAEALVEDLEAMGVDDLAELVIPMEVHLDEQGMVRRMITTLQVDDWGGALGDLGSPHAEGELAVTTRIDLYDLGEPVDIVAPPAASVMSLPSLGGGLLGEDLFGEDLFGEDLFGEDLDLDALVAEMEELFGEWDADGMFADLDELFGDWDTDGMIAEMEDLFEDLDLDSLLEDFGFEDVGPGSGAGTAGPGSGAGTS